MLNLKCSVKSKHNSQRLKSIKNGLKNALVKGITEGGETIKEIAASNVNVNSGELRDSINFEIVNSDYASVSGVVKTGALPQAVTLEYGTGEKAEEFTTAKSIPWAVHESQAPKDMSKYKFKTRKTEQGIFYIISGASAHPYMRPAFEIGAEYTTNAVADAVADEIGRVT